MIEIPIKKMDKEKEMIHKEKMLSYAIKLFEGKEFSIKQEEESSSLTLTQSGDKVFLSDILSVAEKLSMYVKGEG